MKATTIGLVVLSSFLLGGASTALAQRPGGDGPPGMGPGGGGRGFGGFPNSQPDLELVKDHDADGNGWLNAAERAEARKALEARAAEQPQRQGRRRRGRGFGGGDEGPAQPGPQVSVKDVPTYADADLYDTETLRTFFLEFESDDWEAELAAFKSTDVEVPATLTVDGQTYEGVGVSFRGASSFMMVPAGYKRSFNLALDLVDNKQRLHGRKTLNLLNGNGDSSFMSSVLYSAIARQYMPAPKANFARVVVNGESWGVYSNVEQFNKDFLKDNFGTSKGTRWKVSGSPRGDGGLRYLGEDVDEYRSRFAIKSKDNDEAWNALIHLCQVLNETPLGELEAALEPLLDVDGVLWFLALDVTLANSDGYWVRASDYSLYLDPKGMFHVVPHDMNEALREGHGPRRGGMGQRGRGRERGDRGGRQRGGPPEGDGPAGERPDGPPGRGLGGPPEGGQGGDGGRGAKLDPLIGMDDESKPLRSRLLKVPSFRARYLHYVRTIAERDLSWDTMGPNVASLRALIASHVEADTKKRTTYDAFLAMTAPAAASPAEGGESASLHKFTQERRAYLLSNERVVPPAQMARQSIVINELMARNTSSFVDESGQAGDWLELHNPGKADVSLSGVSLSDDNRDLFQWTFPDGAVLKAGGYIVVWADGAKSTGEEPAAGPYHANFKLSKSGETLYLSWADESGAPLILDLRTFGDQGKDEAVGRAPEQPHRWVRLRPTPGGANRMQE